MLKRYHELMLTYIEQMKQTHTAAASMDMTAYDRKRINEMRHQDRFIRAQELWAKHQNSHRRGGREFFPQTIPAWFLQLHRRPSSRTRAYVYGLETA